MSGAAVIAYDAHQPVGVIPGQIDRPRRHSSSTQDSDGYACFAAASMGSPSSRERLMDSCSSRSSSPRLATGRPHPAPPAGRREAGTGDGARGRSGSSNSDRLLRDGPVLFHSGGRVTSSPTNSLSERNLGMPTLARIFPDSSSRKTYRFSCRISVRGSWLSLVVTRHSVCRQC